MLNSEILREALDDLPEAYREAFTDFRGILAGEIVAARPLVPLEMAEFEADELLAAMVEGRYIDALLTPKKRQTTGSKLSRTFRKGQTT